MVGLTNWSVDIAHRCRRLSVSRYRDGVTQGVQVDLPGCLTVEVGHAARNRCGCVMR